jgi:hypothetical protein
MLWLVLPAVEKEPDMIVSALKRMWHAAMHDDGRLRLAELLARRGARLDDDSTDVYRAAIATRRCVFCNTKEECDAWLASGKREGLERFCPNAEFVEHKSKSTG